MVRKGARQAFLSRISAPLRRACGTCAISRRSGWSSGGLILAMPVAVLSDSRKGDWHRWTGFCQPSCPSPFRTTFVPCAWNGRSAGVLLGSCRSGGVEEGREPSYEAGKAPDYRTSLAPLHDDPPFFFKRLQLWQGSCFAPDISSRCGMSSLRSDLRAPHSLAGRNIPAL